MRGICLGTAADTLGSPATDEYGDTQYCYRTPDGSTTSCPTNYACSLPGPRHGHRALTFKLLGTMATYAIFGGETTDFAASASALSNDVFTLYFTATTVTWIRVWTSCHEESTYLCPEPRRDMAVAIMGNSGGQNGRLLVFGGIGGASASGAQSYQNGIKTYLDQSSTSRIKVFDDLWYLELQDLDAECVSTGSCSQSLWKLVDVPGAKPQNGLGAGVLLDPSDNLYITGGAGLQGSVLSEGRDLFVFQLRDPFYKYCSATGSALTAGEAGVQSIVHLQCKDAFMEPADGASFAVKISGILCGISKRTAHTRMLAYVK